MFQVKKVISRLFVVAALVRLFSHSAGFRQYGDISGFFYRFWR